LSARPLALAPRDGSRRNAVRSSHQNGEIRHDAEGHALHRASRDGAGRDMIKFYEDFVIGEENVLGRTRSRARRIIALRPRLRPQPFHLDEAAGEASIFGGLCASGWHTAASAMRKIVDWRDSHRAESAAGGAPLPPPRRLAGGAKHSLAAPRPARRNTLTFRSRVETMRETRRTAMGPRRHAHLGSQPGRAGGVFVRGHGFRSPAEAPDIAGFLLS